MVNLLLTYLETKKMKLSSSEHTLRCMIHICFMTASLWETDSVYMLLCEVVVSINFAWIAVKQEDCSGTIQTANHMRAESRLNNQQLKCPRGTAILQGVLHVFSHQMICLHEVHQTWILNAQFWCLLNSYSILRTFGGASRMRKTKGQNFCNIGGGERWIGGGGGVIKYKQYQQHSLFSINV